MPVYAILGATGNNGGLLLSTLIESPNNTVHAYCRDKKKLYSQHAHLVENKQVKVFEGSIDDNELMTNCLKGARAVFCTVALKGNKPGCTIAQDTARAMVKAMETLKSKKERVPKCIILSSASTEQRLNKGVSPWFKKVLYAAFSNLYDDLKVAEEMLRSKGSLTSVTFVKPGAIDFDAKAVGHTVSFDTAESPVSGGDLAAGMIEVADAEGGQYDMKSVAVNSNAKLPFPTGAFYFVLVGLIVHFFPWTYSWFN